MPGPIASDSEEFPDVQSEETAMQAEEEKIRKGSAWMWLAVSLILIAACVVTYLALQGLAR